MEKIENLHYKFACPIQIRMSDLDPFAHVNNGVQCNYFDYGRAQYFEQVWGERIDWTTMDLVLVHIALDFKAPIKSYDDLVCETTIFDLGHKSMKMQQQLRDQRTGQVKTVCYSVLAGFDRDTEKSIPIHDSYKQAIATFEQTIKKN